MAGAVRRPRPASPLLRVACLWMVLLGVSLVATPARSQTVLRMVHGAFVNTHDWPVKALHVRTDRDRDWGPNLIPPDERVLADVRISFLAPDCGRYRVRATLFDGTELTTAIPRRLCLPPGSPYGMAAWWFRLDPSGKIDVWDWERMARQQERHGGKAEQAVLRKLGRGVASRDGITLRLRLADGRYVEVLDACEEPVRYDGYRHLWCEQRSLVGTLPPAKGYLIFVTPLEGYRYEWVSGLTGQTSDITAPPLPSPDRRHFVAKDGCEGYGHCRIEIWTVDRRGELNRAWAMDLSGAGVGNAEGPIRWLSADTVEWRIETCPATGAPPARPVTIRRGSSGWSLQPAVDANGDECR